jgi:hypothetical protein
MYINQIWTCSIDMLDQWVLSARSWGYVSTSEILGNNEYHWPCRIETSRRPIDSYDEYALCLKSVPLPTICLHIKTYAIIIFVRWKPLCAQLLPNTSSLDVAIGKHDIREV